MSRVNRYYKYAKLSEVVFRRIVRCFVLDLTATQTARLTGISVRSINAIYLRLRRRMAHICESIAPLNGIIEVDESYFGPRRIRGKPGRGAGGKTIVFGIFQRGDKVFTQVVPNTAKRTIQKVIRKKVELESVMHSDGWVAYDGLVDLGYSKHFRVNHGQNQFADRDNHINGIESFWSFAKRRLLKFNGIHKHTFYLHLKETEFRFNHRHDDLYRVLLRILSREPL